MIWWIRGNSGAGKTTLSGKMEGVVRLDGDALRGVWTDLGLSKKDRWEQNLRVARLAKVIHDQGHDVVVSVICPYRELMEQVRRIIPEVRFVTIEGGQRPSKKYPFEP